MQGQRWKVYPLARTEKCLGLVMWRWRSRQGLLNRSMNQCPPNMTEQKLSKYLLARAFWKLRLFEPQDSFLECRMICQMCCMFHIYIYVQNIFLWVVSSCSILGLHSSCFGSYPGKAGGADRSNLSAVRCHAMVHIGSVVGIRFGRFHATAVRALLLSFHKAAFNWVKPAKQADWSWTALSRWGWDGLWVLPRLRNSWVAENLMVLQFYSAKTSLNI